MINNIKVYLILSLCFLFVACGASQPKLQPLAPDAVILALGDSLTYGVGATPDTSYPSDLERIISRKVINAGISGEETSETLLRLDSELAKANPALVIVCIGGNDLIHKRPNDQIKENLSKIIQTIRQHHAQVILIAVPKFGLSFSAPEFYQELGEEFNIIVDDSTLPSLLKNPEYKSDYIHLNARGYQLLAETIANLLKASGAL